MWSWWIDGLMDWWIVPSRPWCDKRNTTSSPRTFGRCSTCRWLKDSAVECGVILEFAHSPLEMSYEWRNNGGKWMNMDENRWILQNFYYLRYMKSHWPFLFVDLRLIFSASGPPTWEHDHRRIDAFCRCQVEDGKPRCWCFGLTSFGPFNFVIWIENDTDLDGERRDGWDMRQRGGMGWMDHNGSRRIKRSIEDTESMPPWTVRKADEKRVDGWPFLQTCQCLCAMTSVTIIWTSLDILCYTIFWYVLYYFVTFHKAMRKWLEPWCSSDPDLWSLWIPGLSWDFWLRERCLKKDVEDQGQLSQLLEAQFFCCWKTSGTPSVSEISEKSPQIFSFFFVSASRRSVHFGEARHQDMQTFVVTSPNVNVRCSQRI